jgi:hypothetical protein
MRGCFKATGPFVVLKNCSKIPFLLFKKLEITIN